MIDELTADPLDELRKPPYCDSVIVSSGLHVIDAGLPRDKVLISMISALIDRANHYEEAFKQAIDRALPQIVVGRVDKL